MMKQRGIAGRVCEYLRSTRAVSALEYAILVGVIVVAATIAIGTFGDQIEAALKTIGDNVTNTVTDVGTEEPPAEN